LLDRRRLRSANEISGGAAGREGDAKYRNASYFHRFSIRYAALGQTGLKQANVKLRLTDSLQTDPFPL
jgi:hypothetical protein